MLMALKDMVKRDAKQIGEAITDYTKGVNVSKKAWNDAASTLVSSNGKLTPEEIQSLSKGQRYAIGLAESSRDSGNIGSVISTMNKHGSYHTNGIGVIYKMRGRGNDSSDIAAAGRLAAVGVTGFAATAGVLNLVRGDY